MTNIDQFESVFKSASKELFVHEPLGIRKVMLVTDLDEAGAREFGDSVRNFLRVVSSDETVEWLDIPGSAFEDVGALLELAKKHAPSLIVSYRNLHSSSWRWPFTLGSHLTALTQAHGSPVLVMPHPEADRAAMHALKNTDCVMAITDHLTGDHQLINMAVRFTEPGGHLWLTHVEDRDAFERYIEAISKIPSINTDDARETIIKQLLKEPKDYIRSVVQVLKEAQLDIHIEEIVTLARRLEEYKKLIDKHEVDLLVFHTRDEEQAAMHGVAYPLAVELRHIPLLMI